MPSKTASRLSGLWSRRTSDKAGFMNILLMPEYSMIKADPFGPGFFNICQIQSD